ncbi:hypothetical protein DL93DRAFT_1669604 [Clavulina sp. PMI_390]|nr:hypothetical protein DL93DRAFT_1669604 [Clavulina sp. PMI_390]
MLERELIDGVIIGLARLGLGGEEELDYSEQQEYDQGAEAGGFEQHGPSSPGPSIVPAPLGLDSSLASSAAPAPPAPTTSSLPTPSHSSIRTPPTHIDIPPEISTSSPTPSPPTFIPPMSSSSSATPGSVTSPGIASIRSLATDRSTPSLSAGNSVSSESEYSLRTAASPSASGGYDNVVVRNPFDVAAERHLSFPFNGSQSSEELVGEGAIGPTDGSVRGSASPLSTMSSSSGSTTTPSPLSPFSPAAPPVSRRSTDSVRSPPLETIEETEGSTPPLDSLGQAAGLSNRNLMASPWDDGGITPTVEKDRSDIFSSTFTPKLGSTAELEEPSTEQVINPTVSIPHTSNIAPGHSVPFTSSPGQPENNNELSVTTSSPPPVPDDTSSNASVRARTASAPSPSTSSSAASALPDAAPTSSSSVSIAEASTSQPPATDESNARAEEAAMGCVASMSLIAAVAASGHIPEDAKAMFVAEVARVGSDPLFWVRREAAYALGALTKVVDEEMLLDYLVCLWFSLLIKPIYCQRLICIFCFLCSVGASIFNLC